MFYRFGRIRFDECQQIGLRRYLADDLLDKQKNLKMLGGRA